MRRNDRPCRYQTETRHYTTRHARRALVDSAAVILVCAGREIPSRARRGRIVRDDLYRPLKCDLTLPVKRERDVKASTMQIIGVGTQTHCAKPNAMYRATAAPMELVITRDMRTRSFFVLRNGTQNRDTDSRTFEGLGVSKSSSLDF
ncbi:hypothetical protein EVAR_5113_1 [Eumeta japonica]|uniref:Uncharacterized protein n=1 Tax=Eumeta variegata TaxID=151549 RepID=A0A4C1SX02_EUMVA|nr:hypothetical protein EVAR_5113_1 [Eumeta japonica]